MASRLTTKSANPQSGDCRFDPCLGHFLPLFICYVLRPYLGWDGQEVEAGIGSKIALYWEEARKEEILVNFYLIQIKHPGDGILYSFHTANVMPAKLRPQ
jgi:hypothetical protein